jgi:hypothetical protein
MKVGEVIKEFVPCEVCGNKDIRNFFFHVLVDKGSLPYVKCCECEEEYYSATAKRILNRIIESGKSQKKPMTVQTRGFSAFKKQEFMHPLVKVLAHF